MTSTRTPPESHRRHGHRKTSARIQLVGVFAILAFAFGLLITFAMNPEYNRWHVLKGGLFGAVVACTLLFAGIWQRQNWARYVLVLALLILTAVFGMCLIFLLSDPTEGSTPAVPMLGSAIALLVVAANWLMFSKRVRYLTTPPGSGG